ncbi:MAG: hypothetical protein P9L92_18525 [Candidatus Electryonea clarkiae]|nr:hypothetical protein [Candidatus Electryonea clarkiae]MDP8286021.1 hypothetical protein [Candidatus Electryonea clarkiae]
MLNTITILLVAFMFPLQFRAPANQKKPVRPIDGIVVDALANKRIKADVFIKAEQYEGYVYNIEVGYDGRFKVEKLPGGWIDVAATSEGYEPFKERILVSWPILLRDIKKSVLTIWMIPEGKSMASLHPNSNPALIIQHLKTDRYEYLPQDKPRLNKLRGKVEDYFTGFGLTSSMTLTIKLDSEFHLRAKSDENGFFILNSIPDEWCKINVYADGYVELADSFRVIWMPDEGKDNNVRLTVRLMPDSSNSVETLGEGASEIIITRGETILQNK